MSAHGRGDFRITHVSAREPSPRISRKRFAPVQVPHRCIFSLGQETLHRHFDARLRLPGRAVTLDGQARACMEVKEHIVGRAEARRTGRAVSVGAPGPEDDLGALRQRVGVIGDDAVPSLGFELVEGDTAARVARVLGHEAGCVVHLDATLRECSALVAGRHDPQRVEVAVSPEDLHLERDRLLVAHAELQFDELG